MRIDSINHIYQVGFHTLLLSFLVSICCSPEVNYEKPGDLVVDFADSEAGCSLDAGIDSSEHDASIEGFRADVDMSPMSSSDSYGDDSGMAVPPDADLNECAKVTRQAEKIEIVTKETYQVTVSEPIAMYLMLDRSGSMGTERWEQAKYAINKFIGSTLSENINIALQYFPILDGTEDCLGDVYSTPDVPLGRLPDHANVVTRSLASTATGGGTPMEGALRGLTRFCSEYKQDLSRNPNGENCVGVLITDGKPGPCSSDVATFSSIASEALQNSDVLTFTVGMTGASFSFLNAIAEAGGSDCDKDGPGFACDISGGSSQDFLEALETIRDSVTETRTEERTEVKIETLDCEWQIPHPPKDETFDRELVNVTYSDDDSDEVIIGKVPSIDNCDDQIGWYYDISDNPTKIVACPKTCNMIKQAVGAKLDILLGCETVVIVE